MKETGNILGEPAIGSVGYLVEDGEGVADGPLTGEPHATEDTAQLAEAGGQLLEVGRRVLTHYAPH